MRSGTDFAIDTVVVGAGVIGIAIARELAMAGRDVLVVEQEQRHGQHQSSRNSGVVHAGFYYPPGSVKARLCHEAKVALYRHAEARGIAFRVPGKIVVAADASQVGRLEAMAGVADACGLRDVRLLDARALRVMEPALAGVAGLWSPSTGIIDAGALMLSLRGDAEAHGATFAAGSRAVRGEAVREGWRLLIESGGEEAVIGCRLLVNSAGLGAVALARWLDGYPAGRVPESYLAKGSFYVCEGGVPFARLIYPLPGPIGLGVHLTIELDGRAKFGPDVEIVDAVSYAPPAACSAAVHDQVRGFWPGLRAGSLVPSYAGIRAKIGRPGDRQDWVIDTPDRHGVPGLVTLFGMESPGLTCAMAIGREVALRVRDGVFA